MDVDRDPTGDDDADADEESDFRPMTTLRFDVVERVGEVSAVPIDTRGRDNLLPPPPLGSPRNVDGLPIGVGVEYILAVLSFSTVCFSYFGNNYSPRCIMTGIQEVCLFCDGGEGGGAGVVCCVCVCEFRLIFLFARRSKKSAYHTEFCASDKKLRVRMCTHILSMANNGPRSRLSTLDTHARSAF